MYSSKVESFKFAYASSIGVEPTMVVVTKVEDSAPGRCVVACGA